VEEGRNLIKKSFYVMEKQAKRVKTGRKEARVGGVG